MEAILSVFFIIIALLAFSAIVPLPTQKAQVSPSVEAPPAEEPETPKTIPQTGGQTSKPSTTPSQPKATTTPPLIDTFITLVPKRES
jgi:hypothetical protein